ncbi:MAG: FliI/YscN family ATPase [Candidatus Korobacteraceae bacterium]
MTPSVLLPYFSLLESRPGICWQGKVTQVVGNLLESAGPPCSLGECCEVRDAAGHIYSGEVVGFRGTTVLTMPLEKPSGVRYGDPIVAQGKRPSIAVGEELLGRVIDGTGCVLDGRPAPGARHRRPLDTLAPLALQRLPIRQPLGCGIRAIDAFLTCGRGQRLGIFGGSGVGKSTLIGMMARGTAADLTVLALVGERGREVGEFLEALGKAGRQRSVVVVSTSDQSPLLRIRAALAATSIAEYFCQTGKNVLLVVDSLTRFAMAQREIGLAAGEPPTAKAYTPSVFSLLARLVERAGSFASGSITAFYTVLMEGDDQQDPLVDALRSLLDGHIMLDRRLAAEGHYPPIALLDSLSRLMPAVASREHLTRSSQLRSLLSAYARSEDLIRIGAYNPGSDPLLDRAIALLPGLQSFLRQAAEEKTSFPETLERLLSLSG